MAIKIHDKKSEPSDIVVVRFINQTPRTQQTTTAKNRRDIKTISSELFYWFYSQISHLNCHQNWRHKKGEWRNEDRKKERKSWHDLDVEHFSLAFSFLKLSSTFSSYVYKLQTLTLTKARWRWRRRYEEHWKLTKDKFRSRHINVIKFFLCYAAFCLAASTVTIRALLFQLLWAALCCPSS